MNKGNMQSDKEKIKSKYVSLRLTEEQNAKMREAAKEHNMTITDFIIYACDKAINLSSDVQTIIDELKNVRSDIKDTKETIISINDNDEK